MPMVREDGVVRPLLPYSRSEIENEMKELGLPFLEDPSNQESRALRNWLRLELFPMIEKRRQGSLRRLALSLENLAEAFQDSALVDQSSSESGTEVLDRQALAQMSPSRRRAVLARILRSFQVKNHSTAHLNELAKRLSPSSRGKKFHLLTLVWRLNAEQIRVSRE
jgi:tRNA(Ile)-lysidine synthase